MKTRKPTVGLAFSGASSRSMFYIGFLEVLQENKFPIDYIAALSGGAIVAASYSSGTMPELKKMVMAFNKDLLFSFIQRSKGRGGIYSLSKVESELRVFTLNKNFEDVYPKLGFGTTDLNTGEEVVLQIGDIAHAICASCTLPLVFEPMEWGNRRLVDGGIVNVVPGNIARDAGTDLVIGIDMRATPHIFSPWQISLKKMVDFVKHILWPKPVNALWEKMTKLMEYPEFDNQYTPMNPRIYSVLDRSIELAMEAQKKLTDPNYGCDLLIAPQVSHLGFWKRRLFLHFTDFSKTQMYYDSGRQTAKSYLPKMWQMLADKEKEIESTNTKVQTLLSNTQN